jgi:hypothetical protein
VFHRILNHLACTSTITVSGFIPILRGTMSQARKKTSSTRARTSDAERLLERASKQPGVADLLKLYEQHAKTIQQGEAYLQPRNRFVIFSTSDATA